ncbi:MAG: hypothetical protein ACRDHE_15150, partial [Ktedonobacterales bacterium]
LIAPHTRPFRPWREQLDPQTREETVSTYYVLYQLLHIFWLRECVELDERWHHIGPDDANWQKYFRVRKNRLPRERHLLKQQVQDRDNLVLFLLAIQNRYRPEITGTFVDYQNLDDWFAYRDRFSPAAVLAQLPATDEQLRAWREDLCRQGKKVDPLEDWYDLVGYITWSKREKLGGPARLAQELYVMAEMISRFLRDRAREAGTEEPLFTCLGHPEYEKRVFG